MPRSHPPSKVLTDPSTRRPGGRRLTAEQRRAQLLEAAASIVVAQGIDALTMEAVALEAGASKTLGYAYFAHTDELLQALWARELSALFDTVQLAAQGADGIRALFGAMVEAYFDLVAERGVLLFVLQSGMPARRRDPGRQPAAQAFVAWLTDHVRVAYEVPVDVARDVAVLAGSVPGLDASIRRGRVRDRDAEQRCLRFILGGLDAALAPERVDRDAPHPA